MDWFIDPDDFACHSSGIKITQIGSKIAFFYQSHSVKVLISIVRQSES